MGSAQATVPYCRKWTKKLTPFFPVHILPKQIFFNMYLMVASITEYDTVERAGMKSIELMPFEDIDLGAKFYMTIFTHNTGRRNRDNFSSRKSSFLISIHIPEGMTCQRHRHWTGHDWSGRKLMMTSADEPSNFDELREFMFAEPADPRLRASSHNGPAWCAENCSNRFERRAGRQFGIRIFFSSATAELASVPCAAGQNNHVLRPWSESSTSSRIHHGSLCPLASMTQVFSSQWNRVGVTPSGIRKSVQIIRSKIVHPIQ